MLKPLGDNVIVLYEQEPVSEGGIYLGDAATMGKRTINGMVVAVGPGKKLDNGNVIPMTVDVGDRVVALKEGLRPITYEGEDFFTMKESNILGILE